MAPKTKKKKARPLSPRQKQLVKNLKKTGGNITQAGKMCDPPYPKQQNAWSAVNCLRKRPDMRAALDAEPRLALEKVAAIHADLLEATKPIGYINQYIRRKDGGVEKIGPDEAVSNDFLEWADWASRATGLKLLYQLRGELIDRLKIEQDVTEESAMLKIAGILKGQGKTWPAVRKHLATLGASLPDGTPDWWETL